MLRVISTSLIMFFVTQSVATGKPTLLIHKKEYIFYNFISIFCLYSFFNMLFWNYEFNFLILISLLFVLSLAMFYVHEFRGTNINFSDISSIGTAKEVAAGYEYKIMSVAAIVLTMILIEYILHFFVFKIKLLDNYHKVINGIDSVNIDIYRLFWHEVLHIILFFVSFFILRDKISDSKFDYSLSAGENEGYIYNFISSIPIFHKANTLYGDSEIVAKRFLSDIFKKTDIDLNIAFTKYAHNYVNVIKRELREKNVKTEDLPHIIVIMNESFGSIHNSIKTNIPVTPFFDSLSGVTKGNLYVNTFGGGTANTEFEFLTYMTVGNYEYPVMPYNSFVKREKHSLARYFNEIGYNTIAMHPYTATNYNRNKVYKYFGFNELVFIDGFKNKELVRNYISDKCMYDAVIEKYEANKSEGNKMFLFGVTMQNHSGYQKFEGASVLSHLTDYNNRASIDSYLSLMKISDEALKDLIKYFDSAADRVIILFFGDHNASFGTDLNKLLYGYEAKYEFGNEYKTPFFIYDNKNKLKKKIDNISANFLSLELLNAAGLPFDPLQKVLNDVYSKYSAYNYHMCRERNSGTVEPIGIDDYLKLEREYFK